jgi:hypothetical protein
MFPVAGYQHNAMLVAIGKKPSNQNFPAIINENRFIQSQVRDSGLPGAESDDENLQQVQGPKLSGTPMQVLPRQKQGRSRLIRRSSRLTGNMISTGLLLYGQNIRTRWKQRRL